MDYKNKYIIITIFTLVLIFGLVYWYSNSLKIRNKIPESIQMTEEQKLDILSLTTGAQVESVPDLEKKKILSQLKKILCECMYADLR